MKINYFAADNFRCLHGGIEKNKLEFKDTNTLFIFGQNNVGKSTFLKAYEFFYYESTPNNDDFYKKNDDYPMTFELEVQLDELDNLRIEDAAPKAKESYKKYLIDGNVLRLKAIYEKNEKSKIAKQNYTWNPVENGWEPISYASIGLHRVFQSCMPKPIFIKAMPSEDEVKSILNEILRSLAEKRLKDSELAELQAAKKKIAELQEKMYKSDTIEKYEESINDYYSSLFPDTSISIKDRKSKIAWTENKLGRDYDIEFNKIDENGEIDENIPVSVSSIGHGAIRTAIFTLLLMRDIAEEFERKLGRKDYIVLFEEPELFLYPKIIYQLRDLIYQVSQEDLPYQLLCASHSPQMIDLSQAKSSVIRMVKDENDITNLYQINDKFLKEAKDIQSNAELKQVMYEILRFNPYICESFYSNEVILIEGPTEEIIIRAYLQEISTAKHIFVLNCGSVTNIPFYQKIFSKFSIKYNIICDTDDTKIVDHDENRNPVFETNIQGSISKQFILDKTKQEPNQGIFRVHDTTFEPAHQSTLIPKHLLFEEKSNYGKPYNANLYWQDVLKPNINDAGISQVPIIRYIKEIVESV
ncbi:MAG: AAA family ATPase [Leptospirales bacterium]